MDVLTGDPDDIGHWRSDQGCSPSGPGMAV